MIIHPVSYTAAELKSAATNFVVRRTIKKVDLPLPAGLFTDI